MGAQSLRSKKGEIEFRKKVYQKQVAGENVIEGEFDAKTIQKILSDRMKRTFEQISLLKKMGITISPYLEVGAERCQRSLVMENNLSASGAAMDLSYDSLRSCDYYRRIFKKSRMPLRVCGDAYHLPFMTNSVPFVFCYETLHHFPDPTPIVKEIHRVMSPGGYFFFDEEPFARIFHLDLYQAGKLYSEELLKAGIMKRMAHRLFAKRSCNELEHGIVENDELSASQWKRALSFFEQKEVKLQTNLRIESELVRPTNYLKFVLSYFVGGLFGGKVSGICRKSGMLTRRISRITEVLICPSCTEDKLESKLVRRRSSLQCTHCNKEFPVVGNVAFLFSYNKLQSLYPKIFDEMLVNP